MSFAPYPYLRGDRAEAFGAGEPVIMRLSKASDGGTPGGGDRVIHAEITLPESGTLMASDCPPGTEGDPPTVVSVMHPVPDPEPGRRIFERLGEGGEVVMPFAPTLGSRGFGMLRDRFGTHWMISAPAPEG